MLNMDACEAQVLVLMLHVLVLMLPSTAGCCGMVREGMVYLCWVHCSQ